MKKLYNLLQGNPTLFIISILVMVGFLVIIMSVFVYFKIESERKVSKSAIELNRISNSIHAGLVHFSLRGTCEIYYASKGFYNLLCYTKNETREEGKTSIIDFLYEKDRKAFSDAISSMENDSINLEVRLLKKDGQAIYCLMSGNYAITKDGQEAISAVFVDITEQKNMQEMLRMDRERYRIASELSHDVLFEYYVDIDKMVYTDRYLELFGRYPVIPSYVKDSYKRKDLVHPDDYGIFLDYCSKLAEGREFIKSECRIKGRLNDYIWCQLMGKTIYDKEKNPSRVIGKLINIDYQKRELDSLEYKATRDPLTGVYNREVTIKKIEKYIKGNQNGKHALMFIDFDDFKSVNDSYGHLIGDMVLIHIIESIKSVFTEGEIIGRIGGDEFVVFVGYVDDKETVTRNADTLVNALSTTFVDEQFEISISGSVGIACYPEDGLHYEQLNQCADKALYRVKSMGKNNYMFYSSTI